MVYELDFTKALLKTLSELPRDVLIEMSKDQGIEKVKNKIASITRRVIKSQGYVFTGKLHKAITTDTRFKRRLRVKGRTRKYDGYNFGGVLTNFIKAPHGMLVMIGHKVKPIQTYDGKKVKNPKKNTTSGKRFVAGFDYMQESFEKVNIDDITKVMQKNLIDTIKKKLK